MLYRPPVNELPFGHVDTPPQGAQVKAETGIAGWALDDRGIKEIRVYIDNHIVNTGTSTELSAAMLQRSTCASPARSRGMSLPVFRAR